MMGRLDGSPMLAPLFVLHQAWCSMGPTGVHEGFSVIFYISKNGTDVGLMKDRQIWCKLPRHVTGSGAARLLARALMNPDHLSLLTFVCGNGSAASVFTFVWIP